MAELFTRIYTNLAGCDFSSDPAKVSLNRSPNCINMYKDYSNADDGQCVQTRPGFKFLSNFYHRGYGMQKINSLFLFDINNQKIMMVHAGYSLYAWDNYPAYYDSIDEHLQDKSIFDDMNNDVPASFVIFNNKLYINDGKNYLVYDGTTLKKVAEDAFIPTTTISRLPSGGGTLYQAVNVLTGRRRNSFVADGTSTEYYLDTTFLDDEEVKVYVNDVELANTEYSVNRTLGCITFNNAPASPLTTGQDNVVIEFSKVGTDYLDRIPMCKRNIVFDNRIFFTGNSQFKNAIFHCELNNPAYISDLAYYQDGTTDNAIKDFTVGNNLLWVFKESSQQNDTIFYHEPTIDVEYGKIYPSKQGNISTGCVSKCVNFNDDIVFFSNLGLEGITGNIQQEQLISHRSTLIDSKFINENNYDKLQVGEWEGYLVCLLDGKLYLADSRQVWRGNRGYEYEWYYWEFDKNLIDVVGKPNTILSVNGDLLIGTEKCWVFSLDKTFTKDYINGNYYNIYSCWQTPYDIFGDLNNLKTTNKRGGVAKIKTIPNGKIKVSVQTNRKPEKFIKEYSATGFDFNILDFNNFAFTTKAMSYIVYKIKMKKFIDLSLKFYSEDKPFGLFDATLEVYKGSYVKRT